MMRLEQLPKLSSFHVVSDIHMRAPSDLRTQIFLKYLEELCAGLRWKQSVGQNSPTSGPEALFLLGDIFDFIYFPSKFHRLHWKSVFDKFTECKNLGLKIYFIEGNHDFGFEHGDRQLLKTHFTEAGDFAVHFHHPKMGQVELMHGDNVVCPASYHQFRGIVKSKIFQKMTALIPGALTYFIFSKYAALSRTKDKYRSLDKHFFKTCVVNHLNETAKTPQAQTPDLLILGHVHVWVDGGIEETCVCVGPDWFTAPSVLKVNNDGECERQWLTAKAPPAKFEIG
jgi:UDP-2,3-diacylglucosamine hydrolase